jgi:1,4-alpha-glucan branching enzyme
MKMNAKQLVNQFFNFGTFEGEKYFGVHRQRKKVNGKVISGFVFRLYAPNADQVSIVGDFNRWTPQIHKMDKIHPWGIFEGFVKQAKRGDRYKYQFKNAFGVTVQKADPYALAAEKRPKTASIITTKSQFRWQDHSYMSQRSNRLNEPMSIYEVHLGSWKKPDHEEFFTYRQLAKMLIPYVKEHGFTHLEIMPLTQHPFDGSWGYQTTGFFALDSRYGSIQDFQYFVNQCHQAGLGVILDFVVVHFANDGFGLYEFDGTKLYEYFDPRRTYSQWGSPQFDLGKPAVRSLLFSSINYFISQFHLDGIRIDAVSNIVYWDGDAQQGENRGGISFIRDLNQHLHQTAPTVMCIAEDSTAFNGVTKPIDQGGLGFDYKWDMGWMNDTLKFYGLDPVYKFHDHHKLTFSMHYFYSERFMLPFSHDEVVHGKGTILNKMYGNYEQKFSLLRNLYTYQWLHPGKKLSFMGNEFASFDEWNEKKSLPWFFLQYPKHDSIRRLIKDLNRLYQTHPALYQEEDHHHHFSWVMVDNRNDSIYAFQRQFGDSLILVVFNMKGNVYHSYDIGVLQPGPYEEVLNSDTDIYGGQHFINAAPLMTKNQPGPEGRPHTLTLQIGSFAAIVLKKSATLVASSKESQL